MTNQEFIAFCKKAVCDYTNEHLDKSEGKRINGDDVYVVWSCKTLQNNKALLSTTISDGMKIVAFLYRGKLWHKARSITTI